MRGKAAFSQILFLIGLLAAWEGASRFGIADAELLPPFSTVIGVLWELIGDAKFLGHAGDTLVRVVVAFAIGAPVAISCGFLLGEKLHFGEIVNPVIHFVLAVPQSVFLPIFILAFGIGFLEKVVFGITHVFFVVVVNTIAAVRAVSRQQVLVTRSFGATPTQIYLKVYLPAMLPLVTTGLRIGMIFTVIGVLLAEMYGSRSGIGLLIFQWGESYEVPELMAGIVVVSVGTILLNEAMRLWEAHVGRWQIAHMSS